MISLRTIGSIVAFSSILAISSLSAAERQGPEAKKDKLKPYPLETCIVTGEKLGEMGDPFLYKYQGREIKFCCKGCLKDFNKEPAKYIKKLEEEEKKVAAKKGQTKPPVSKPQE